MKSLFFEGFARSPLAYDESTGRLPCSGKTWGKPCNRRLQLPGTPHHRPAIGGVQIPPATVYPRSWEVSRVLLVEMPEDLTCWTWDEVLEVAVCPQHRGGLVGRTYGRSSRYGGGSADAISQMRDELFAGLRDQVQAAYARLGLRAPMLGLSRQDEPHRWVEVKIREAS